MSGVKKYYMMHMNILYPQHALYERLFFLCCSKNLGFYVWKSYFPERIPDLL